MKCEHKKTVTHLHRRKNYPFGKKSKSRPGQIKFRSEHCTQCNKLVGKVKIR